MRVIVCGVLSAVVATAAWMWIEHATLSEYGWMAWGVGLITGLGVHAARSGKPGGRYFRGVVAAILALSAVIGGKYFGGAALAKQLSKDVANAVVTDQPDSQAGDAEEETSTPTLKVDEPAQEERIGGGPLGLARPRNKPKNLDMVWLCLAGLTAYVVGKGRDETAVVDQEPAAEPSDPEETAEAPPAE